MLPHTCAFTFYNKQYSFRNGGYKQFKYKMRSNHINALRNTPSGPRRGAKVYFHSFFSSALDGVSGQIKASAPLPPRPGVFCRRGWLASRAGLDGCGEENLSPPPKFYPRTVQVIA